MKLRTFAASTVLLTGLLATMPASATTIDFEGPYSTGQHVGSTYAALGVTFDSTFIFVNGSDLDPNFPVNGANGFLNYPRSPGTITFTTPVTNVSLLYAASITPVTLTAYDSLGNVVGSDFGQSYGVDSTLEVDGANIAYIVIDDDPNQAILDDLSFNFTAGASPVPEPSGLVLLGSGALAMLGAARRRLVRR